MSTRPDEVRPALLSRRVLDYYNCYQYTFGISGYQYTFGISSRDTRSV